MEGNGEGKVGAYALLEGEEVVLREGVGLGNDRDNVHARPKTLHNLNIERLETIALHEYPVF